MGSHCNMGHLLEALPCLALHVWASLKPFALSSQDTIHLEHVLLVLKIDCLPIVHLGVITVCHLKGNLLATEHPHAIDVEWRLRGTAHNHGAKSPLAEWVKPLHEAVNQVVSIEQSGEVIRVLVLAEVPAVTFVVKVLPEPLLSDSPIVVRVLP